MKSAVVWDCASTALRKEMYYSYLAAGDSFVLTEPTTLHLDNSEVLLFESVAVAVMK